jgi:hypothetical protein
MLLDPLGSIIKDYLTNLQFFSNLFVSSDFAQSLCSSPTKTLKDTQRSSKKLTQFTMISKVQGPLSFNINASLTAAVLLPFT